MVNSDPMPEKSSARLNVTLDFDDYEDDDLVVVATVQDGRSSAAAR
jgi:hypothetical protein